MSDCVNAGEKNSEGQIWCKEKDVYVNPEVCDDCEYYEEAL